VEARPISVEDLPVEFYCGAKVDITTGTPNKTQSKVYEKTVQLNNLRIRRNSVHKRPRGGAQYQSCQAK
jgi:hypothetical protein